MGCNVCLQFGKEIVKLPGYGWYLEGLEQRPWSLWDCFHESMAQEIDKEGDLDRILKDGESTKESTTE